MIILIMVVILFLVIGIIAVSYRSASRIELSDILRRSIVVVVLIFECIVYWVLRRRFYRISWVWTHIALMYFSFLILPMGFTMAEVILSKRLNLIDPEVFKGFRARLWMVYWGVLIIAQFFFLLTIVRSYSNKESLETRVNETTDTIDKFTD